MKVLNKAVVVGQAARLSFCLAMISFASLTRANPVDKLLKSEMQQHHVVGVACLVMRDGKTFKTFYGGEANLEWHAPVDANTVFEIGSISKQFAAASILLLAQEGKLSLDDPISKYLTNTPPAWADVRIRNLLSHTSGIHSYDDMDGFELRQHLTQAQFIAQLSKHAPDFAPGEKWHYCNAGFSLLGYIVENISGENYWTFLQQNFFGPLQMTRTTWRDPWLVIPHRATGYAFARGAYSNRYDDLTDLFAAGSIISTASDLAKWDRALMGTNLLAEASKELWWTPAHLNNGQMVSTGDRGTTTYGFGWFLGTLDGHKNIGHGGITSGFSAANEMFPDDHLTVIVLSNTDEGSFAVATANDVAKYYFSKEKRK